MTLTLNPHACRQPIWAQVRQVKPALKCNTNNYGVSLTTTKHAEIIHQSTPQIRITSQYLPIAQMTITSVRNKFVRPTSPGATRATTSQRVPSKYPADPTFRWEICSIPPQFPIMFHTTAGPRFNVEKVCEPWTRSFHEWRMTCQSQDQSMPGGGPTIARSNFRQVMSIWYRSPWWSVRCPAPKRATGETVASKNRNRSLKRAEWSQRICLWEKNVLEAACRWCVTSNFVRPLFPMQKIHPNHLYPDKHQIVRIPDICQPFVMIHGYAVMLAFSFPFSQTTLQSSIEKHWAEDVALFDDSTLNIKWPASMHRTTLRMVNRLQ